MVGRRRWRTAAIALSAVIGLVVGCAADVDPPTDNDALPSTADPRPDPTATVDTAGTAATGGTALAVTVLDGSESDSVPGSGSDSASATGSGNSTTSSTDASSGTTTVPSDDAPAGCRPGTTLCVGPSQPYTSLVAAVDAAEAGAVIELLPGRYNETVAVRADNVTIRSRPDRRATIDCGGLRPAGGKACILAVGTNLSVENLVVTGARGPDANEACFRNEPGTRFVVRGVECFGSNNGILGSGGSWLVENSYFHGNGAGDGQSHNLYFSGDCSELVVRGTRSVAAVGGHALKSRCRSSTIENSELVDNAVADAAEFPDGGAVTIRASEISQPDGANGNIIRHGAESCAHPGTLTITDSTLRSARSPSYIRSECAAVSLIGTALPPGMEVVTAG